MPGRLFADVVDDWAQRQPDRIALVTDDATLDYEGLSKRINRYARWARSVGVAKGDTVALIMPNGIDYVAAWLGISRVGGVVALINTKLVGQSLAHCIDVAKPAHIIVAHELTEALGRRVAASEDGSKGLDPWRCPQRARDRCRARRAR